MTDTDAHFLDFIDRCIEDDPLLVVLADADQLQRLAKVLDVAKQGIKQYSEALHQLS